MRSAGPMWGAVTAAVLAGDTIELSTIVVENSAAEEAP